MKKVVLILLVGLLIISTFVGCGSKAPADSGTTSTAVSPASTVKETNTDEKVEINFACTFVKGEGGWGDMNLAVIDKYVQDNPNVKVNIDAVNSSDYENSKFKTMAQANMLPELFMMLNSNIPAAAQANLLMNWDPVLNGDAAWKDTFLNIWDEAKYNGSIYGIPFQFIINQMMFYNSDMLAQVGYSTFPTQWDDFLVLCEKLKAAGKLPLALGDKDGWPVPSHLVEILSEYQCGPDWVKGIAALSPDYSFMDPSFIAVLSNIDNLVKKGYFNKDIASIDHNTEDITYLYKEQAAMYPGGPWQITGMMTDCPPEVLSKIKVAPFPAPSNPKSEVKTGLFTGGSGWEYGCNTKLTDAQKKVCVDIIKALTSSDYAAKDAELGRMPVLKSQYVGNYDKTKVSPLTTGIMEYIAKCPTIPPMNQQRNTPALGDVFYKKCQELVAGMSTPEQVAADIQTVYEAAVKQNTK